MFKDIYNNTFSHFTNYITLLLNVEGSQDSWSAMSLINNRTEIFTVKVNQP